MDCQPNRQGQLSAKKAAKIRAGMAELDLWLQDLVRRGWAALPTDAASLWHEIAARMVDAQAPEIARELRAIAQLDPSDPQGSRLLARLGRLYSIARGWQRFQELPPETQADLRSQVGWTQPRRDLLIREGIKSRWWVLGRHVEAVAGIAKLKSQRIWLWGEAIERSALLLGYAHGTEPFYGDFLPGTSFEAELVFYESGYPLRAVVKGEICPSEPVDRLPGYDSINDALQAYSSALGQNPWLERFPLALAACVPQKRGEVAIDGFGKALPVSPDFTQNWQLAAVGGGLPISVFGEWNGEFWLPLSAVAEGRFVVLGHG
ncbi:MAG TPA: hypothetical protein IGS31_21310 [Oscillatoriales cyanobacterium M4454_W2019_049]|nr:hypothetical protein [Oscillatoriales cyanobacterium M4454_W2019_049]